MVLRGSGRVMAKQRLSFRSSMKRFLAADATGCILGLTADGSHCFEIVSDCKRIRATYNSDNVSQCSDRLVKGSQFPVITDWICVSTFPFGVKLPFYLLLM